MSGKQGSTAVEIYGQSYNVRGDGDPAYLMELARFVDARMHEVADRMRTTDVTRIAILAALNIADELGRYRQQSETAAGQWVERTENLIHRLDEHLVEPSGT